MDAVLKSYKHTHTHTHPPSIQSLSEWRAKPRIRYLPDARRFQRLCRCYLRFSGMPLLIQLFGEIISQSAGGGGGDALLIAAHSQSRSPDLTHLSSSQTRHTLGSRALLYLCLPLHRLLPPRLLSSSPSASFISFPLPLLLKTFSLPLCRRHPLRVPLSLLGGLKAACCSGAPLQLP